MIIREMKEADIPFVCDIESSIFSKPWSASSFRSSIKDTNNIYLVVEDEEQIIGYCGLWGIVGEGQINNVAVKKEYRNKGIGKKMLQRLLELGKENGLEEFTLEVRVSNKNAIQLYKSLSFKDAGIRRNFYEEPVEDAIIMWYKEADV
jgi:ribosomal-protein-alanine N-acetyltransferase